MKEKSALEVFKYFYTNVYTNFHKYITIMEKNKKVFTSFLTNSSFLNFIAKKPQIDKELKAIVDSKGKNIDFDDIDSLLNILRDIVDCLVNINDCFDLIDNVVENNSYNIQQTCYSSFIDTLNKDDDIMKKYDSNYYDKVDDIKLHNRINMNIITQLRSTCNLLDNIFEYVNEMYKKNYPYLEFLQNFFVRDIHLIEQFINKIIENIDKKILTAEKEQKDKYQDIIIKFKLLKINLSFLKSNELKIKKLTELFNNLKEIGLLDNNLILYIKDICFKPVYDISARDISEHHVYYI